MIHAYQSREPLAEDVVRVLREELHFRLAAGAALVQLDEPVPSEVVMTGASRQRTSCAAPSARRVTRRPDERVAQVAAVLQNG